MSLCRCLLGSEKGNTVLFEGDTGGGFPARSPSSPAPFHLRPSGTVCAVASTVPKLQGNFPNCSITCWRPVQGAGLSLTKVHFHSPGAEEEPQLP